MTALASVGDTILCGDRVPDNVYAVRDVDGDRWVRNADDEWETADRGPATDPDGGRRWDNMTGRWFPFTVIELRTVEPSTPARLALPEIPPGTVALIGDHTRTRWTPDGCGWWVDLSGVRRKMGLGELLQIEGFATPVVRKVRTWPRVEHVEAPLPEVVETSMPDRPAERWTLVTDDGLYTGPRGGRFTLVELRTFGDVTEVLTEGDGA